MRLTLSLKICFVHKKSPKWRRKQVRKRREAKDGNEEEEVKKRVEVLKAAAQAWLSRSINSESNVLEFEARRKKAFVRGIVVYYNKEASSSSLILVWEYGQSLWDPYEILSVSKKLERALTLEECNFSADNAIKKKKQKEP
ncbi:hypothetical protein Bca52824_070336 [Brassica carinata]|uniref:Uncharacterized protein n=1 Tax=Brassica carinata TaxID=52824 RepID=A0A8X7Q4T3_BRACI|nr:hypothetical protein Bca52824_070336 [Brassica carinata]